MPNPADPFEVDEGVENIPVVKASAQSINKVATTTVKHTAAQAKALTKAFVSQLYGSSTQTATVDDQQQGAAVNTAASAQKAQTPAKSGAPMQKALAGAHIQQHAVQSTTQTASTPEEQAQIEETRKKLYQQSTEYYDKQFGNIADVEANMMEEAQKRVQRDQEREQEKEEEKKQLAELEEQKKKEPIAVTRAKNKAESNRGAAG